MNGSIPALFARLVVSLGIVIGLMCILAGVLRRRGIVLGNGTKSSKGRNTHDFEIVARKTLGKSQQLAVIQTNGKTLVLGITEHQITLLTESETVIDLDTADVEVDPTTPSDANATELVPGRQRTALLSAGATSPFPTWKTFLDDLRERTVRHSS